MSRSKQMWYADYEAATVTPVEVEDLGKVVLVGARKRKKRGIYHGFFETREEAVAAVEEALQVRIAGLKKQLYEAQEALTDLVMSDGSDNPGN